MRLVPLLCVALLLLLGSRNAVGAQISLAADLDNTIFAESENSGGSATTLFAGQNNQGNARRTLVHFDIAGNLPQNANVTNVVLKLTLDAGSQSDTEERSLGVHRVMAAWGEGTSGGGGPTSGQGQPATAGDATWTDHVYPGQAWTTPGGDFVGAASSTAMVGTTPGDYFWDSSVSLVDDVRGWLAMPAMNHGWIVLGFEGTNGTIRRFHSREAASELRPTLTIDYVLIPEPSTVLLLAIGLCAWCGVKRVRSTR
jgi:hypothetical protein